MKDCIFCSIIAKESPATIEYEDDDVLAFWDVDPKAPIHILIVPKKHITSITQIQKEDIPLIGKLVYVGKILAQKKQIDEDGYRLVFNVGRLGGQIVDHIHLHLLGGQELNKMI